MKVNRNVIFTFIGIATIFLIATVLSLFASSYPDGLEKVAENFSFIDKATNTMPQNFFLTPDYAFRGIESKYLQTSLAGFFGIIIILLLFSIIYLIYKAVSSKKDKE